MKNVLPKTFDWTIAGVVLVGLGFLGVFFYTNYQYEKLTQNLEEQEQKSTENIATLDNKIKNLAQIVESTLSESERSNRDLREELEDITDAVDTLGRVATTDRDLLRKYSKTYFLNENYMPLELRNISASHRSSSSSNFQILADVRSFLEDLINAAEEDGLKLLVQSAYRSFGTQSALKAQYTVIYGEGANRFSADQGYSEHQLGTTVDFTTRATQGTLEGFENTPEYEWLLENAHKYGFILSYPAGNSYYKFEPWHWRFVGVDLAEELYSEDMAFYDMDQRVIDSYLPKIFD